MLSHATVIVEGSQPKPLCGNFAVLVDLHILPLGGQDDASWFSPEHRKEVGVLIRDALELRVRQFQEARYQKIQPKPRKDLTLTAPLCLEGGNVRLAVHFMKRHVNLRCIVRQHFRVPNRLASNPNSAKMIKSPDQPNLKQRRGLPRHVILSPHRLAACSLLKVCCGMTDNVMEHCSGARVRYLANHGCCRH
ncbi:SLX4IP isoform X1 [Labeo rohita]|uniref:SLX4IP isoform X1 n=1 Tax=Labeo rohita TaxID=84645 RepID=A0A498L9K9_LABRO|nr:SLX4IP isoform X1 [Labeo rohita]